MPDGPDHLGLRIEGISHRYGVKPVLEDVSLDVAPGEILCLLGPSGCGKTTTLRLIAGLEEIQSGGISINGQPIAGNGINLPPERRGISLLFQDFALFPHLTVRDNVGFGLSHLSRSERSERIDEVLQQVGLAHYADRYPHELSGGEQQRVALARARAPRPGVMLLDEPFSNLDVRLRRQVRDIVLHVLKHSTASTLMVTHDPEEAMFMADKIAVMYEGRILQIDTPERLYTSPATPFVAGLFSEMNQLQGQVKDGHVMTVVGRLCTPELSEGTAVDVLIRPDALRLGNAKTDGHATASGRVMASRMLGKFGLVHLSVGEENAGFHLHARIPGRNLPAEDDIVGVTVDPDQVFVFPAVDPT